MTPKGSENHCVRELGSRLAARELELDEARAYISMLDDHIANLETQCKLARIWARDANRLTFLQVCQVRPVRGENLITYSYPAALSLREAIDVELARDFSEDPPMT